MSLRVSVVMFVGCVVVSCGGRVPPGGAGGVDGGTAGGSTADSGSGTGGDAGGGFAILPPGDCVKIPSAISSNGLEFVGDPEFDGIGSQVAWQEFSGALWVAAIDPTNGQNAGAPTRVATDVAPLDRTYNGAEWAFSQQGAQLVYTWSSGEGQQTAFGVAVLTRGTNGAWAVRRIAGKEGVYNPRASKNRGDARPLIQFLTGASSFVAWSTLDDNAPTTIIDGSTDGHWADGDQLLTYIDRSSRQVRLHDPQNPTLVRTLTTDDTTSKQRPYMWRAPDFGNRRMLFARVGSEIRFYLERAGEPLVFDPYRTFTAPSPAPYNVIASPEPTVRNGRSFLSYMASSSNLETDNLPAEIWLAPVKLDAGAAFRVSEANSGSVVRTDPEPFDGPGPMFVYYTRVTAPASQNLSQSELTSYRCTTGL